MNKKQTMEHTKLLVLSLLSSADMYGYQMITELERRSNQTFHMKEGTLYPILHGLQKDGFVEAYQQETPQGRVRKYYHLTKKGKEQLLVEEQEWASYSQAIHAVLQSRLAEGMA